jgi:AcrR family transcriptional regulator
MPNLSPDTRRRILAVASDLFAQRSFEKVRMEDVAAGAGVGKVTIYRYFPAKDDLYLTLLEETGRDYLARLREADTSVRGCRARLVALVRAALTFFDERPHLLKLLDRAGIDRGRKADFPWLEVQQQFFRMLQGLFAEGALRGEFQVDDLELAVRGVVGTMRFQFLYPCVEVSREDIPDTIVGMLVRPAGTGTSARAA